MKQVLMTVNAPICQNLEDFKEFPKKQSFKCHLFEANINLASCMSLSTKQLQDRPTKTMDQP